MLVLHHGKGDRKKHRQHILVFEGLEWPNTPDSAINELCRAIERLSPAARKVWNRAKGKEFNVGYQLETGMQRVEVAIGPKTLRRIVSLGATVAFTCYQGEGNDPRENPTALAALNCHAETNSPLFFPFAISGKPLMY